MAKSIEITEEETVALLNEARRENPLNLMWGSGRLEVCPENQWALERLAEMRGVHVL